MPIDLAGVKLGVSAPSPATPHFHHLNSFDLKAPLSINWGRNMPSWSMLGNNLYGCCTIASLFHYIEAISSYAGVGKGRGGTTEECLANHARINGFDLANPSASVGGIPNGVLQSWLDGGLLFDGSTDKALAVFKADPKNLTQIDSALTLFGPLVVVASLPQSINKQNPWTYPSLYPDLDSPGSAGLHQMILLSHLDSEFSFATWNETIYSSESWWFEYIIEAWAVIHPAWLEAQKSLFHFDYSQLITSAQSLYLTKLD